MAIIDLIAGIDIYLTTVGVVQQPDGSVLQRPVVTYKIPVNPEKLKRNYRASGRTVTVIGTGEVALPDEPKLYEITWDSFFPNIKQIAQMYVRTKISFKSPEDLDAFIVERLKSKEPIRCIIPYYGINALVTVEDYTPERRFGDHEDIYYSIKLREYRHYSAKVAQLEEVNGKLTAKILETNPIQ